ncbi:MAG: exodeoxyribonuclease VII large subunit [Acidimicrobiia bacterium]|nr:exodeoxyribonuclease VII large subunit [Acidimicrobiia bacterium]
MSTYTVAELSRIISQAIGRALPEEVWVEGEIRDLSRPPSGHVYFSLVDPDGDDPAAPTLPVTLFASDKFAVNRVLQRSGAVRMTDGVQVRIRGQVSYYAARGTLQLRMTWIDTDYTLGKLAAERERLIRSLDQRGLLEKNRSLPLPLVPLRVGLITSAGSAAEADFLDELRRSGFAWRVRKVDARVQGAEAVRDVVAGLATLATGDVDAIALVRGGGAQTDLAAFDREEIAVAVANCSVPVLTGIGHEIDVAVVDLVARSHKTPTACAAALVGVVTGFVTRLNEIAAATKRATSGRVEIARRTLTHAVDRLERSAGVAGDRAHQRLRSLESQTLRASELTLRRNDEIVAATGRRINRTATFHLDAAAATVDRMSAMVGTTATRRTLDARNRLDDMEHRLSLLDPERLLARGWSITRTASGEIVMRPADVAAGTTLRTTVAGGEITSVVAEESNDG